MYWIVYEWQISYSNLSLPVTLQLRRRAKAFSDLLRQDTYATYTNTCTHVSTCTLAVSWKIVWWWCAMFVRRGIMVGRQWEWRKAEADAVKSLTWRQALISLLLVFTYCVFFLRSCSGQKIKVLAWFGDFWDVGRLL